MIIDAITIAIIVVKAVIVILFAWSHGRRVNE